MVNGVVLPFVLIFVLLLVNDKALMGGYVNARWHNVVSWVTVVGMITAYDRDGHCAVQTIGDWRLAIGDWRLEIGDWRLAIGYRRLAIGDWRLAIGQFDIQIVNRQSLNHQCPISLAARRVDRACARLRASSREL